MKKILITGSNGMLGQKIVYGLLGDPYCRLPEDVARSIGQDAEIIATAKGENRLRKKTGYTYEPLDITDREQVQRVLARYRPDAVIHTAAMTNVDACELDQAACRAANVEAVRHIVDAMKLHVPQAQLVHVSTDFVFDGMKGGPYTEEDVPNPQSYYALSKHEGEKIVSSSGLKWAILRTIIVYCVSDDSSRSNLVLWVKNNLEKGQKINVITDQFRAPTLSEDLAQACITAAMRGVSGIYHTSGPETHSIIDLAYMIADFWKLDRSFINPVTSLQLNQPARRPPRTGFVIDKARRDLSYSPRSFPEGLAVVDAQLKQRR
ncbi:MAG: SDR family oxidoreductase [Bacteroidota bacterium]